MLGKALKMAFWVTYDHVGKLLIASLLWFFGVGTPSILAVAAFASEDPASALMIGVPAAILALGVAAPILSAGLSHMVKELIETRDGSVGAMFSGVKQYWKRALGIGLAQIIAAACLATSAWFYPAKLAASVPFVGYLLSALAVWALALLGCVALYTIPALVQKKGGVKDTLKLAAVLVMDNPMTTIGLAVQMLAITVIALLIPVILVFLYGGLIAVMRGSVYELMSRRYARQAAGQSPDDRHISGVSLEEYEEAHDDYLNRGVRDFLFPWKG